MSPHPARENVRDRADGRVADRVTVGVVDLLQVVDVDEDEREWTVEALRALDLFVESCVESATVEEAGQRIGFCLLADSVE